MLVTRIRFMKRIRIRKAEMKRIQTKVLTEHSVNIFFFTCPLIQATYHGVSPCRMRTKEHKVILNKYTEVRKYNFQNSAAL